VGPVEYARAGVTHVAFQRIVGDPASDLVVVMVNGYLYPMEVLPEDPIVHEIDRGVARLGTLVMFGPRGIGLSDQIVDWETHVREHWSDDVAAVVDALGRRSVSVFSWHTSGTGRLFAARHAERIDHLILFNPLSAPRPEDRAWIAETRERLAAVVAGEYDGAASPNPSRSQNPTFQAWQDRAGRPGASPSQAARIFSHSSLRGRRPSRWRGISSASSLICATRRSPGSVA
jgi:pimeloyl-ACP methyl ester carboxylesterase